VKEVAKIARIMAEGKRREGKERKIFHRSRKVRCTESLIPPRPGVDTGLNEKSPAPASRLHPSTFVSNQPSVPSLCSSSLSRFLVSRHSAKEDVPLPGRCRLNSMEERARAVRQTYLAVESSDRANVSSLPSSGCQ